jgi:hypothetical protein
MPLPKRKKPGQSYASRRAAGRRPIPLWFDERTEAAIAFLARSWGMSCTRDVVARAIHNEADRQDLFNAIQEASKQCR